MLLRSLAVPEAVRADRDEGWGDCALIAAVKVPALWRGRAVWPRVWLRGLRILSRIRRL